MAAGPHRPRSTASDLDYWLRRCEGFRVDSPQGRVGFVEEVRYASRCDRPDVIAVRAGRLGRLLLIIPVEEVAEIPPGEELVVLHRSPRPSATESPQTRRRHVQPGGPGGAPTEVESAGAGTKRIEAQREVEAVINRLRQRMRLRRGRGGEEERRPVVEESAERSAEEQPAQEQAGEEPAAEEAPSERAAEAAPAEEPAAEEPPAEEQTTT
jgi:hypothetical protein